MTSISPFREDLETGPPLYESALSEDEAPVEREATHPLLAVFPLPGAVLDALAGGLSPLAVGLAASAGYKDVNQLTNIVFYFRHPDMIGRKIPADRRDLATEWISIRDSIVKPALRSIPAAAPPASSGSPPAGREALSSSRLVWPGSTDAQLAFMQAVYDAQVRRSRGDFVMDLPETALDPIEGHKARKDAAAAAKSLLAAARAELALAHPNAHIGILSAYRSATRQFAIWQGKNPSGKHAGSGFPHYYQEAIQKRIVDAGDFSPAAAEKVAAYLGGFIASPGYSNHQDGLAFDFGVGQLGGSLGRLRSGSWFHRWLQKNAKDFEPLATEAWHWTYRSSGSRSEVALGEVASPSVRANGVEVPRVPMLSGHRGRAPDLILRWNDMSSVPAEIDVVVHLHGFWYGGMELPRHIEPVSGLDLVPIKGATGAARSRPTLTILPRAHDTGVRQKYKQKDGSFKYGYNVMTFPALVTKDGLSSLVRLSLDRFAAEVGAGAPQIGRLILTAHSGGGKALLEILKHHDPHQVHVYDALYWAPGPLEDWARKRIGRDKAALAAAGSQSIRDYMSARGGALRVFYQGRVRGGTRSYSQRLLTALAPEIGPELASWYRVEASKYDHFQIPRRYGWRTLADASADVPDAYVEQAGPAREGEAGETEGALEEDWAAELEAPPLNDIAEPVSGAEYDEVAEAEFELEEPEFELDENVFEAAAPDPEDAEDETLALAFDAADLIGEGPNLEEAGELELDAESGEVELGEVEAFLEDFSGGELEAGEAEPAKVTFPSGATLNVVSGATGRGEEHYDPNATGNPLLDTSGPVRSTLLSVNFTVGELARSGGKVFAKARIDPKLVSALQQLREKIGKPMRVTSGYRPYLYNVDLYTKTYKRKPTLSRHSSGQAADVKIAGMTGMEIAKAAIDVLGAEIGVGIGADYAHIDVRGQWARWSYRKNKADKDRDVAEIDAYRRGRSRG
jgi:LAS superfamily LD-carboxypeptidase LdcB